MHTVKDAYGNNRAFQFKPPVSPINYHYFKVASKINKAVKTTQGNDLVLLLLSNILLLTVHYEIS